MNPKLSELSLQELWQLFPIILTEHQECWNCWYEEELSRLQKILPEREIKRISPIGSTAVPTIWAKPIVDILLEILKGCQMDSIKEILERHEWVLMSHSDRRISFNKGYTDNGFDDKVFHLHVRYEGDNAELYFRDYLNEYPSIAKEYEKLKLNLWKKYEHDRDGYTAAKTEFIEKYTKLAKQKYGCRYE